MNRRARVHSPHRERAGKIADQEVQRGWFGPMGAYVSTGSLRLTPPFGPQSQWSILLHQREQLHDAIDIGREHLEQLRRHVNACGALLESWLEFGPGTAKQLPADSPESIKTATLHPMEQFLNERIRCLEEQLAVVTSAIEGLPQEADSEAMKDGESIFNLLRAAG